MGLQVIREAIQKHRGGFEDASDEEILRIWQKLDQPTQDAYLLAVQQDKKRQKGSKKHAYGVEQA